MSQPPPIPQVVRLEFQLTPHDVQETLFPPIDSLGRPVRRSRWRSVFGLLLAAILLACGLMLKLFTGHIVAIVRPSPPPPPIPPELDNLWLALVPSLLPVLLIAVVVVRGRLLRNRRLSGKPIGSSALLIALLVGLLVGTGMHAMDGRDWALPWNPTPAKIEMVAFAPWAALFVAFIMYAIGFKPRKANKLWNSLPALQRPKTVVADDQGIDITDELYRHFYRWEAFKRFAESPNLFLLYLEDARAVGLPKRAIQSEIENLMLRRLMHEHIGRGTFLPGRPGFNVIPQPVQSL